MKCVLGPIEIRQCAGCEECNIEKDKVPDFEKWSNGRHWQVNQLSQYSNIGSDGEEVYLQLEKTSLE